MDHESNLSSQNLMESQNEEITLQKGYLKVKKWRFKFTDELEFKDLEEALRTTPGEKKKGDKKGKPALYDRADGFIIDEGNKEVFVYFPLQLQFKVIVCYPYIIRDSLKPWITKGQGFEQCVKLFEGRENLKIIDLTAVRRKKEGACQNSQGSKLQYKQKIKRQERAELAEAQLEIGEEELVQTIGLRILEKEKYDDIYLDYAKKKDVRANFIMHKNRDFLCSYESIADKIQKENSDIPSNPPVEKGLIPFKFENIMEYDVYRRSKANSADTVNKKYLKNKAAQNLEQAGFNYYQVLQLANQGENYEKVKEIIETQEPHLKSDAQYEEFLRTILKPTNEIAKRIRKAVPEK